MREDEPEIVKDLRIQEQLQSNNSNSMVNKKMFDDISITRDCNGDEIENHTIKSLMEVANESNTIVVITDAFGTIIYVNQQFTKTTGYEPSEVLGENPRILKSDNHPNAFYEKLWGNISKGHIWTGEFLNKKKDGTVYWEQAAITPITDQTKKIKYYFAIKEEISNRKDIQEDLRIKENALLSSINAIILTDLAGKITYVNPSFLGMWGFDSERRVIGKPVYSLWKKGGEYFEIMDEIIKNDGWLGEVVAKGKTGRLFQVQMSASIVKDDFDNPLCIMSSFVDITKQKRLEKKFRKFKTISDKADYGSILYDLEGTILYVNTSFAEMHGHTISDLLGKNLKMFYSNEKQHDFDDVISELNSNGHIVGKELWHLKKNQSFFPLLMTATVIKDSYSNNQFAAGTVIDITERKDAEKKIKKDSETLLLMNQELQSTRDQLSLLNKNLEKEVKERTKKIRSLINQKDGFINQLSHDLKTPLTPMYVLLPILKKSLETDADIKSIDIVIQNVHFMKELVIKTIDLAKINSETLELKFQNINLKNVVTRSLENNQTLFSENNIIIDNKVKEDIEISANALRLQEVFNNLITNAIKYMQKTNGSIIIDAKEKDDEVLVSVKDTGIGMTKEQCDHIFDEFYKVDESRHHLDSTGLGLTITKKIIEKHGGAIWVESPGMRKGSTFYFTLLKSKEINKSNNNV